MVEQNSFCLWPNHERTHIFMYSEHVLGRPVARYWAICCVVMHVLCGVEVVVRRSVVHVLVVTCRRLSVVCVRERETCVVCMWCRFVNSVLTVDGAAGVYVVTCVVVGEVVRVTSVWCGVHNVCATSDVYIV